MKNSILREAIIKYGSEVLSELDLVSLILGEKISESMKDNQIYSVKQLLSYSDCEIKDLLKITDVTLTKIKALTEFGIRNLASYSNEVIRNSKDVVNLSADMEHYEQEVFRMYCLDSKNKVIKTINLFKGGINTTVVDVRIVFKEALKCNAAQIIVCHNHPSGDVECSREDIHITDRIKQSGEILGVKLLDHVIIGSNNKFFSFKDKFYI